MNMKYRLDEQEAAEYLGYSVETLRQDRYRKLNQGRIIPSGVVETPRYNFPFIKDKNSSRVFYVLSDLNAWLKENEQSFTNGWGPRKVWPREELEKAKDDARKQAYEQLDSYWEY